MRTACLITFVLATLAAALPAGAQAPRAGSPQSVNAWTLPPQGYAYEAAAGCNDADKGEKRRHPVRAAYKVCDDQMRLLDEALLAARKEGKLLLVEIGGTWCAYCGILQRQLATADLLGWTGAPLDLAKTYHHVEIGVSTLYRGDREDIPSGHAALRHALSHAPPGSRLRALPFLLVIDPTSTARVFARNIGDVPVTGQSGYDPTALRAVLVGAYDYLRNGGPPPSEPGWLKLKLKRLFGG